MVKPELEELGVKTMLYKSLQDIKGYLKEQGIKKLYLDFEKTTLTEYQSYKELKVKLVDGSKALKLARSSKTEYELEQIKKACNIAQNAYASAISKVRKGMTELELKDLIVTEMINLGADCESFDTIVAFGKNSAVPHHRTGESKLEDNSVILVDTGCMVNGYCSDITRTAYFGKPSEKFLSVYNAVLSANLTAIDNITDGTNTLDADAYARNLLKEKGYGENFTHSLGHGVGLEIHEFPTLSPKKSDDLSNGMVFTIEPGAYFDGEFGVRIEDTVALINGKVERLFNDSKELKIIK
jgi:Xaa-Pro aminopeptidase